MKKVFGVTLDPDTEVNHAIGSKPALAMLPAVLHQPRRRHADDRARLPRRRHAHQVLRRRGLQPAAAARRTASIPTWTRIPADIRKRAKLLVINYPNSPTGAVATRDFYRQVIDFAQTNQIVVVQDAAHILLSYDGPPLSFLQVDGAKEVGVEIHSMSKGFNMIGWRMAFVCRPSEDRAGLRRRQGQLRFGPVHGDPAGGARRPWSIPEIGDRIREKYRRRLQKLVAALNKVGFQAKMPAAPTSSTSRRRRAAAAGRFANAEEASQFLITEQSVCCVPWDDAGPFLRFSVTYLAPDEAEEDALMAETVERLGRLRLQF